MCGTRRARPLDPHPERVTRGQQRRYHTGDDQGVIFWIVLHEHERDGSG
jgi:hypothetical protein